MKISIEILGIATLSLIRLASAQNAGDTCDSNGSITCQLPNWLLCRNQKWEDMGTVGSNMLCVDGNLMTKDGESAAIRKAAAAEAAIDVTLVREIFNGLIERTFIDLSQNPLLVDGPNFKISISDSRTALGNVAKKAFGVLGSILDPFSGGRNSIVRRQNDYSGTRCLYVELLGERIAIGCS